MTGSTPELLSESQYLNCLVAAVRRMAVTLNHSTQLCPIEWLKWADDAIATQFAKKAPSSFPRETYDKLVVRARTEAEAAPGGADKDKMDQDAAEYFFYGRFEFRELDVPPRRRVEVIMQEAFLKLSRQGLHLPPYEAAELGVSAKELQSPEFISGCATNYLLKNFWHNYVHNVLQFISFENYRRFGGDARYEADFEADNLANLFLIHSYGLPVRALGIAEPKLRRSIAHLLRRNRCNDVFRLRAAKREEVQTPEEKQWRYRRTLANYLSGWTAVLGCAVTSIGVYLRPNHVIVSLNGMRFAVDTTPDLDSNAELRHAQFRDIATTVGQSYSNKILSQVELADYVSHSLLTCFTRAGFELVEEVMPAPTERPQIRVQRID